MSLPLILKFNPRPRGRLTVPRGGKSEKKAEKRNRRSSTDAIFDHVVGHVQRELLRLLETREKKMELLLASLDRLLVEAGPH